MTDKVDFSCYEKHYSRMLNVIPDWDAAEHEPSKFACQKDWLPKDREARILDFGCGWGHQLLSLWVAGFRNLEGVELVPEQASIANQACNGRIKISCMDGRNYLSNNKNYYDFIIINDVLEHIPVKDSRSLLESVHGSLVSEGTVVIRVPNASSICSNYSLYLDITHVTSFTEFSLMQLLDQAGFDNHRFISDSIKANWKMWRPWKPWRGLAVRPKLNHYLHQLIYSLRCQEPKPTLFGYNLECYSTKVDQS